MELIQLDNGFQLFLGIVAQLFPLCVVFGFGVVLVRLFVSMVTKGRL